MLALLDSDPTFYMDKVVNDLIDAGALFCARDITKVALMVFFLCLFFHAVQGAGELSEDPPSCRFFKSRWWLRMAFCLALLIGYRPAFEGFARSSLPTFMTSFAGSWVEIWDGQLDAKDNLEKFHHQNQDVKKAEVTATRQGQEDQAWWGKAMAWAVDALVTSLAIMLSTLAGMAITVLILIQGFWVLGINVVLLALGPLCVAFLAHEATEGVFWSWAKTWLVYGVLYLPVLGLGVRMAAVVFKGVTSMVVGSDVVFGDGSDIAMHFVYSLLGPLCSLAVVRAIPSFLAQLIAAAVTSQGSVVMPSAVSRGMAAFVARFGGRAASQVAPAASLVRVAGRTEVAEALGRRPGGEA